MILPEGSDASAICPRLKKTTYGLNQNHESDLDKPTTMAAIITAIEINTNLQRSTMMANEFENVIMNKIANDCQMATELVPKVMGIHPRA
jgi:hypothetical protein